MNAVLNRLARIAKSPLSTETIEMLTADINSRTKRGWTNDEIFEHMKNIEDINPDLDEDLALHNMKRIREKVQARLNGKNS